jgi:hypothetical protein
MIKGFMRLVIKVHHDFGDMEADLRRIQRGMDFSQVVLEGINAIQKFQKQFAPIGKSGKGPHGRIPRSIQPATIYRKTDGSAWAFSRTSYGPAVFTNEGTGTFGPRNRPYFVGSGWGDTEQGGERGFMHPGIQGTHWFERGANMGSPIALAAFQRKVETMLRVRGR